MGMTTLHWFWSLITVACLVWYSTVTVYVAIRGATDIRVMLGRLRQGQLDADADLEKMP